MLTRRLFVAFFGLFVLLMAIPCVNALPVIYSQGNDGVFVVKQQKIDVEIYNNLAQTTVDQIIVNTGEKEIPCSMDIKVPAGARANSFMAIVDGKIYQGVIRKKTVAREIVKEAKENKKAAALVEELRNGTLHLELSQVKAGQEFQFKFSYIQENIYKDGRFKYSFELTDRKRLKEEQGNIDVLISMKCTMNILSAASSTHDLLGDLTDKFTSGQ